jgi:regulatory protein
VCSYKRSDLQLAKPQTPNPKPYNLIMNLNAKATTRKTKPYTFERAWNYVLWLLGRQAYTAAQVKEKLVRKEVAPEIIGQVLEKLGDYRFLDDARYAENYIQSRQKHKGKIALKQELRRKGVDEKLVEGALLELNDENQLEHAVALLQKQLPRLKKTDDPRKSYGKAYAFLARKGFTSDIIRQVLEKVRLEEDEESAEDVS